MLRTLVTFSEAVAVDVAINFNYFLTADKAIPHRKIMYPSIATAKNWDKQEAMNKNFSSEGERV